MQKKIIVQYYVLSFMFNAGGIALISAVYATFLLGKGLNLLEINLLNTIFFLTMFVCEIPTGAFADIFGRKNSFLVSCGLLSLSLFIYGNSESFAAIAIAEMIGAFGSTFESGAFQSWLVDSLKHHGYEGECRPIFGRAGLVNQIANGSGAVAGSYLAVYNPSLPWFAASIGLALTGLIAYLVMKEEYFEKRAFSWKKGLAFMRETTISSIKYGINERTVRFILVVTGLQIMLIQGLNMYWQPFFKGLTLSEKNFGFIFVGIMTSSAIGAFLASKLKGREKTVIVMTQIISGALIIGAALTRNLPLAILLFLLHEIPRGLWKPVLDSYLHDRIPSKERATVVSFCSVVPTLGGAIGLVLSGLLAQYFGITFTWIVSGTLLILGALLVNKMVK